MGIRGAVVSVAHIPSEKEQVGIFVRFEKQARNSLEALDKIKLMSPVTGKLVPLKEVVKVVAVPFDGMITSKDLRPMVWLQVKWIKEEVYMRFLISLIT
jgi:Cu/Ag efflux pump CusA